MGGAQLVRRTRRSTTEYGNRKTTKMAETRSQLLVCDSFSHDSEGSEVRPSTIKILYGHVI